MTAFNTTNKGNVQYIVWAALAQGVNGKPWERTDFTDKCYQLFGTFGGGTFALQGSNDPRVETDASNAVWFTLKNASGTDITGLSAAGGAQILESPRWIRPAITGGDGTTALTVAISATRGF